MPKSKIIIGKDESIRGDKRKDFLTYIYNYVYTFRYGYYLYPYLWALPDLHDLNNFVFYFINEVLHSSDIKTLHNVAAI